MSWMLILVSVIAGSQGTPPHVQTIQAFETEALCKNADQALTQSFKQAADFAKLPYSFNFVCVRVK